MPVHNHNLAAAAGGGSGYGWGGGNSYSGQNPSYITSGNKGGGQAHPNLQPYITLSFIIKV